MVGSAKTRPVSVAVIGAGERGGLYSRWVRDAPGLAKLVAVAEPRDAYRARACEGHDIAADMVFGDWRELAARDRLADLAIISVQDAQHSEVALALAPKGYNLLLEKPLAPTLQECHQVVDAAKRAGVVIGVAHIERYTLVTRSIEALLAAGRIGEIVTIDRIEPLGFYHQAHSYVRGNWANEARSSFMLLAKSCHDIDWISHIAGKPAVSVSSFGSLRHFTRVNQPAGAAERCTDCSVELACAYSARRIYGRFVEAGNFGWPLGALTADPTPGTVDKALREGPYGRCVYACDNDVVDHQVVAIEFATGITATFTMSAFTRGRDRETRIGGTKGEITTDGKSLQVYDFLSERTETIEPAGSSSDETDKTDWFLRSFIGALAAGDPSLVETSGEDSLASHELVFAAETARREGRVVRLADFCGDRRRLR